MDEDTAERYAAILDSLRRVSAPIPTNDVWIAASAMQHGSVLLTTDPHFRAVAQIVAEILEPHSDGQKSGTRSDSAHR